MLSVAQDLVNQLTPYQNELDLALDAATFLPLVGEQLADLPQFDTILQDSLPSIEADTQGMAINGHHALTVPLPSLARTFTFDLGLDAFLLVTTAGGVSAAINPSLTIGFDYQNGVVTLDADETALDIGFNLSLPNFQATMSFNGLLFTHAVDAGTNFQGDLGFHFDAGGGVTADFTGVAQVRMALTMSFVDPAQGASFNPTFHTTLDLDWGFGANNQLMTPIIELQNFSLDADSFLHGFLGDVVKSVQKFTKPIQPFIDMFETPVPIVSAFGSSETIGTLMLKGSGQSQVEQDRFELMVEIVKAVNTIDLSGGTAGAVIPFGTIKLTGDAQSQLPGAFGFDTSLVTGAIDDILNSPALQEVQDALETVGNYAGLTTSSGFKFPLLENPGPVIGAILTGQIETMFSFSTGRQHFELAPSIGVGIEDLFGVFLKAGMIFDANLSMGYDTAGLIKVVQDPSHDPAGLLHGFYFDNSIDAAAPPIPNHAPVRQTGLYLQGLMRLSGSVIATLSGGLYANIDVELVNTDTSPHVYLDSMLSNLSGNGKVFKLGGKVYASADISLTFPDPVGPDITLFHYNLAHDELLNFDPPPPPSFNVPVVVIDVTNQHTLLLDINKMSPGSVVTVQPFHDFTITSGGNYVGDGIRVDYPNEIDLFVERKNDLTTNYYNLIGLGGLVPDGASIQVTDPFRVFIDEGAPSPYPAQTKPGVLLVGGKNVAYKYSELSDGTKPNVLLVGGYGSNTLAGGTMTFGNFIPGDRIAQAKAHFADTTGYDGAGQSLINSVIDAAIAPTNPAGIIGATMTGSRGGLMLGGPGNNSFFAAGAGNYEMIGGAWVNSFNISPSFSGGPATYQIDGGPFGQSGLVVRVPFGEMAEFQNGTAADKYHPEFKSLDILSNAGLFTTAHGIQKVLATGFPGSTIVFGDTSELDIQFSVKGSATVKFAGTAASDDFEVGAQYDTMNYFGSQLSGRANGFFGTERHLASMWLRPYPSNSFPFDSAFPNVRVVPYDGKLTYVNPYYGYMWVPPVFTDVPYFYAVPQSGLFLYNYIAVNTGDPETSVILPVAWEPVGPILSYNFNNPLYTVTRTFGTNGRTQNISFEVDQVESSSIILDGRGASDDYDLDVGLGSFLDITIDDTDAATQNSLRTDFLDAGLLPHKATLTDNSLNLEFYTPSLFFVSSGVYNVAQAVRYTPTIFFGDNTDITLTSAFPFKQTIIDRPTAPQNATVLANGVYTGSGQLSIYSPVVAGELEQTGTFFERFNAPTVTVVPGDYDGNGVVGPEDYNFWRGKFGMAVPPGTMGDGNGNGVVDAADYVVWRNHLGAISPASGVGSASLNSEPAPVVFRASNELSTAAVTMDTQSSIVVSAQFELIGTRAAVTHAEPRWQVREPGLAAARRDDGLLAWLASRIERGRGNHAGLGAIEAINDAADGLPERRYDMFDTALETLLAGTV